LKELSSSGVVSPDERSMRRGESAGVVTTGRNGADGTSTERPRTR